MKSVNIKQLEEVKKLMRYAINQLRKNGYALIEIPDESQVVEIYEKDERLERKLHEVYINHRLACYIEEAIKKKRLYYYVDIEYNRYYKNKKMVNKNGELKTTRPDILVHTRIHKFDDIPQHYIVIEAKKR